jgi:glycosyltransferase involved in cell wall biosynthesis
MTTRREPIQVEPAAEGALFGGALLVAVCICTRDRTAGLARCLSSVLAQRLPAADHRLQIIVVDNSVGGTERGKIESLARQNEPVIYVHEPRAGIPFARNAALHAALALGPAWIAFLDDDEVAPPGWLAQLLRAAQLTGADVVHGRAVGVGAAGLANAIASWRQHEGEPKCRRTNKAATNNVLFRAWIVADPIGLRFDEQMRDSGGSDGEFFMRAGDAGARMVLTDGAPVFEVAAEERATPLWQRQRAFRVGANCNYRYRKNRRPGVFAALLILGRVVESSSRAALRASLSLLLIAVSRSRAQSLAWKGVLDVCFAWGCVAPYFGVRPKRYY